jgi:hypothetical protein
MLFVLDDSDRDHVGVALFLSQPRRVVLPSTMPCVFARRASELECQF